MKVQVSTYNEEKESWVPYLTLEDRDGKVMPVAGRRSTEHRQFLKEMYITDAEGTQLTPADGEEYLEALPVAFSRSTHIQAEILER